MSASIGAALKVAREKRQLTLAQVSEITRVRGHYLQALENDDVSAMPSAAQARGFLKIYAEFLGLDLESLIRPPAAEAPATSPPAPVVSAAAPEPPSARPNLLTWIRNRIASRGPEKAEVSGAANTGAPVEEQSSVASPTAPAPTDLPPGKKKAPG